MRLLKSSINPTTHKGPVTLRLQDPEDMWHLYNLVRPGDIVTASARRKVVRETGGAAAFDQGKSGTSTRIVMTKLAILVTKLDFDAQAAALHISGRVCEPNDVVEMWAFHTLDLDPNSQLVLEKGRELAAPGLDRHARRGGGSSNSASDEPSAGLEVWDSVARGMLAEATDVQRAATAYAVVLDEGLANVCVLTEYQTVVRQRIEVGIARKRAGPGADAHDKSLDRFYAQLLAAVRKHIDVAATTATHAAVQQQSADTQGPPPLVLASPGFVAAAFLKYMAAAAQREGDKPLATYARQSVIVAHASSGHVHALHEALKAPSVTAKLADTRYARETALMERFTKLIRDDAGWAWYGPREVERAVERGAVGRGGGVLLISNTLFRAQDVRARRRWVALVDRVKGEGGEVRVLSSAHESGRKLAGLGDVGAILTYPILELDEDDDDEDEVEATGEGGEERRNGGGADGEALQPNPNHEHGDRDEEIEI